MGSPRVPALLSLVLLGLVLSGCGIPVPDDKRDYVGAWQGPAITLVITADGRVEYERVTGAMSRKISGPIKTFQGPDFVVGVLFVTTTFRVERPPYRDGNQWRMRVDGVDLTRAQ